MTIPRNLLPAKNLLPASLMKRPKKLEEFQEFFFYWEPNMPFTVHSEGSEGREKAGWTSSPKEDVKEFKLILWNARKIKKLTKSELFRIYSLYQGENCFQLGADHPHCIATDKEIEKDERYIKFKGWKDSDNSKDPMIKKLGKGPDAWPEYNHPDWLR